MTKLEKILADKEIKYINKNIGFFTLITTLIISITSFLIKGAFYIYKSGKLFYWGISHLNVNLSNENLIYGMLLYGAVGIIYIGFNSIPFFIIKNGEKWHDKLSGIAKLITITILFLIVPMYIYSAIYYKAILIDWKNLGSILKISFQVIVLIYFPGIIIKVTLRNKKDANISIKNSLKLIFLAAGMYLLVFIMGIDSSATEDTFKFLDNAYLVIHEDAENFIVSEYEIQNKNILTINASIQKLIKKEGVKTETMKFNKVIKKNRLLLK